MSMKNSNDTIGNQTRDLPVCSTVPQPTAPPRAPVSKVVFINIYLNIKQCCDRMVSVTYNFTVKKSFFDAINF